MLKRVSAFFFGGSSCSHFELLSFSSTSKTIRASLSFLLLPCTFSSSVNWKTIIIAWNIYMISVLTKVWRSISSDIFSSFLSSNLLCLSTDLSDRKMKSINHLCSLPFKLSNLLLPLWCALDHFAKYRDWNCHSCLWFVVLFVILCYISIKPKSPLSISPKFKSNQN